MAIQSEPVVGVRVRKDSEGNSFIRKRINFIAGSNIALTINDDTIEEEVEVTITSPVFSGLTKITVGSTQPTSPSVGDLWVDTS